ncbi:glycosyl transferase family 90-domain-containing protein [Mycena olivaceomarginata]|nr:glycosyl transferase family 90-domain-containing protein [Mycena olivaceomarginata]
MESTVARPLLALNQPLLTPGSRHRQRRARLLLLALTGGLLFLVGSSYVYFGPSAGLPVPHRWSPYYTPSQRPIGGGNSPPPPHGHGGDWGHPQPPPPPPDSHHAPLDADLPPSSSSSYDDATLKNLAQSSLTAFRAREPATLPAARALYTLKTGRVPPSGYDAFFAFAKERECLVGAYEGVWRDFAPFWRMERGKKGWFRERVKAMEAKLLTHTASPRSQFVAGRAHKPEQGVTYFDGDWENTMNKFATHLPPMTVLINARDEPRVLFDVGPLFDDPPALTGALTLTDPTPFTLSPPNTTVFFSEPARRDVCRPSRGTGVARDVSFLLSASSAEFTTDLVPVLSMTKLADASTSTTTEGGGSCFADVLMPGEFYYRNSWWAGKFERPNDVKWEDKKGVLYWRGKSNGGHIRGDNYLSFPRFRLIDLASRPENRDKGLFDVRITQWHEWHCTDNCDAAAIRAAYNITDESVPREEAYGYKYLLDVDGNSFSGRYLGLLRSGGLVFKSTAFAEFFTPWLVPYEHFIPVRPDLADLPAKIEWARANDAEAHRIQETGRLFAEQVLTDAQNDCYWFAALMEWGALWGEDE